MDHLLAYTMSKAAIEAMTLTAAKELAPRGITVNAVAAGLVDTDINADWLRVSEESRGQAAAVSAFGRVGEPADVADVIAFAASYDARWGHRPGARRDRRFGALSLRVPRGRT